MKTFLAYRCHDLGRMEFYSRFTPLGLGCIGALLRRAGHDATVVNLSEFSWPRVQRFLASERPDILGLSVFTFNRHEAMRVAALARAAHPRCLVVAGGPHATHLSHHLLEHYPAVDLVVRGEGEETMLEIVRAMEEGLLRRPDLGEAKATAADLSGTVGGGPFALRGVTVRDGKGCLDTPDRPVIADLDLLPHPAADPRTIGVDPQSQFEFIITSRGCPAACTFCSSPEFWGRGLRFRSAQNMLDEVHMMRREHGVVYVSVRDDTFTVSKKRVIDFCRGLIDSGLDLLWDCQSRVNIVDEERLAWMRRAGCTHIQYGVESGSPRMLRRLNKGITLEEIRSAAAATRKVGLGLSIYLITGIDSETDEDLASTLRLVEEIRPHDGLVSPLTVYPGTGLYEDAKRRFGIGDRFWVDSREEAYYVRRDPWTRRSLKTLAAALRRTGRAAAYGPEDFARQRQIVGDCYALRLSIGEHHERRGRMSQAREEYEAILRDNPSSLWARMRLGNLASRRRRHAEAADHYRAAARIVPAFRLAHSLWRDARRRSEAQVTPSLRESGSAPRSAGAY
ncbi:MAG TPA: radical SAM protein [Candidatus Cryosericum sp.]|nr:radical SAM protein [Candidatus Cryosericum sp.]